jgi:hypothetical protein
VKRAALVCVAALLLGGCASIAPPYPPALNLPARVTDLSALQRGAQIYIQFAMPALTTEALPVKGVPQVDLRIGPSARKFEMRDWLETAKPLPPQGDKTLYVTPAGPYVGKDVVIAVRLKNAHGHDAGWSNFVALSITPAVASAENVKIQATAQGVELSWTGSAPGYRIYRKTDALDFAPLGETKQSPYLDTTAEYGKHYTYFVMGFHNASESEISAEVTITPIDTFAPAVPAGLNAIIGTRSIELNWTRDPEPDLGGYRVYRDGALIAGAVVSTSYSDRTVAPGVHYRYSVSAYDQTGNESAQSAPVEAALP